MTDQSTPFTLETLYSDHHKWLQGWLRRKLGDTFLAADMAQDTFVSVISADLADKIREPRPFLATVARRLMAHYHRRLKLETSYLDMLATLPEEMVPSPETRLQALQTLQQIDHALDGLPAKVKEVFLLVHLEGLRYKEVAKRINMSESSVKQYLTRANCQCLFAIAV